MRGTNHRTIGTIPTIVSSACVAAATIMVVDATIVVAVTIAADRETRRVHDRMRMEAEADRQRELENMEGVQQKG